MRIALISPLPPYRGGISTFSHLLSCHLVSQDKILGINFRRLYPQFLFPGKSQLQKGKIDRSPMNVETILDSMNPASWDRAVRRIRRFRPDVCLFSYWMPFFIPVFLRLLRRLKDDSRTAILCHNVEEHESLPGMRRLKRRFFQATDQLIVLSSESLRQLERLSVTTPVELLFHPLPTHYGHELSQQAAKTELGVTADVPVILYFGLVRPYKGLPYLLEAVQRIRDEGRPFHLRVAGEFYQGFESAETFVARHNLSTHVTLENRFVPDHEVSRYFSAADVVALPYLSATQSGVVPIAYQFNRPVIVTEVGGLPEVVQPGKTGFLVPPKDSNGLADVLLQNLPDGFRTMRDQVAKVKEHYSWESFTDRLRYILS